MKINTFSRKKDKNRNSVFIAEINTDEPTGNEDNDYDRWFAEVTGRTAHLNQVKEFIETHIHNRLPREDRESKSGEKLVFVISVVNVAILSICASNTYGYAILPWYYTVMTPILMLIRYFQYHQRKHHYFMLDFCYWAQCLTLIYLWATPQEPKFFIIIFSLAHGPMAWTIPTYRNSLVFHSVDRLTSVYIHFAPMLVLYVLRWHPEEASLYWHTTFNVSQEEWETDAEDYEWMQPFYLAAFAALGVYTLWQTVYAFIVGTVSKRFGSCMTVYHDKEKMTLYRWTASQGKGWLYNLVMCAGPKYSWYVWVLMNISYTAIVSLPTYLWYINVYANTGFIIFVFVMAAWNGANFYIEAFAKIQWRKMEKRKQSERENNNKSGRSTEPLKDDSSSGSSSQKQISCNPLLTEIGTPENNL